MCSPVNTNVSRYDTRNGSTIVPPNNRKPPKYEPHLQNFASELQSFFALCLMNLVFGSLAMAFGMQFIVTAVLAMAEAGTFQWFPVIPGPPRVGCRGRWVPVDPLQREDPERRDEDPKGVQGDGGIRSRCDPEGTRIG